MNGSACGCCVGITAQTPAVIDNRPGLAEIAYRVGTWAQFKASMLDALSLHPAPPVAAQLLALRTRADDDFIIALCDAFAVVCDILTFYYERSANEHYLRTATQLLSVAELAALIGYEPAPGVAANAALAFTLESPPPPLPIKPAPPQPALVPNVITLAAGTQVQSVPGPGQQPVTFETVAPIGARYAWNALSPRTSRPYAADARNCFPSYLRLNGLIGNLQTGDYVLIVVDAAGTLSTGFNRVTSVTQDTASQTTRVAFENATPAPLVEPDPVVFGTALTGSLSQATIAAQVIGVTWSDQTVFAAQAQKLQWDLDLTEAVINGIAAQGSPAAPLAVYKLGVRASIFGHNAPYYDTLPSYTPQSGTFPSNWENETVAQLSDDLTYRPLIEEKALVVKGRAGGGGGVIVTYAGNPNNVYLDATYPALVTGTWVVLTQSGTTPLVARVSSSATTSVARFLLSSTVTVMTLADSPDLSGFLMRTTAVFGATDTYTPAGELREDPIGGSLITLDSAQLALHVGQDVIVRGTSATQTGQTRNEWRTIAGLALVDGCTQITLDAALDDTYVWNSVTINANVATATHGTSCSQILGSGDATQAYQRFALNALPLTYVSAATPTGTRSTLGIRVNGELWREVPYLYGHGPTERVYVTQLDVNANRYVEFGDGALNGARLPTGQNNVIAAYRQGLGSGGNVGANQLSTLLTRPLGLRSVVNPLAATGGGDPQTLAGARATAPITVRALDRIVSLDDVGDFAAASAGVAKAAAVWAWNGQRRVVCVTVCGPAGIAFSPQTPAYDNLLAAILAAGDGTLAVTLCSYVPRIFSVGATLTVDPSLDAGVVVANAKSALRAAFGFDARAFMQPVFASEVIATLQNVSGVTALTLDAFRYNDTSVAASDPLLAAPPKLVAGVLAGAELLTLDPGPLPAVVVA